MFLLNSADLERPYLGTVKFSANYVEKQSLP